MQQASIYILIEGKYCIEYDTLVTHNLCTGKSQWDDWMKRAKARGYITRTGGNGRYAMIELNAISTKYRQQITDKFGTPSSGMHPLTNLFKIDAAAYQYYSAWRNPVNNQYLEPEQIALYTTNASVLNALILRRAELEAITRRMNNPRRDYAQVVYDDMLSFNNVLQQMQPSRSHNLPKNRRKLADKINRYKREGYACLIDKRGSTGNRQKVTPQMLELWTNIYAGQHYKASYYDVYADYVLFLAGQKTIARISDGEVYNHKDTDAYQAVTERTIYNHMAQWMVRIGSHQVRAGNPLNYQKALLPSARHLKPSVGAVLSIDDMEPPFKYAAGGGNRLVFYIAQDLGSGAFTSFVYGDTKAGIIMKFYQQLVRDYARYGVPMPHTLECEAALNKALHNTLLQPGVMFSDVHLYVKNPRPKAIERSIGILRYNYARKDGAFVARPHARAENFQQKYTDQEFLEIKDIVDKEIAYITHHNNQLHPDQTLYPGMTRWQAFMQCQNPKLSPLNWQAALRHIGYCTPTSMRQGRIALQGLDRVVGHNDEVLLGDDLLNIMNKLDGRQVNVYWLDDADGNVLKAMVYDASGRYICQVLDDLPFHRSKLDQTDRCRRNMALYGHYIRTVKQHAQYVAKGISKVYITDNEQTEPQPGDYVYHSANQQQLRYEITPPTTSNRYVNDTGTGSDDDDETNNTDYTEFNY